MAVWKRIRRMGSGIAWPAIVALVVAGVLVSAGTIATAKKLASSAYLVSFEQDDQNDPGVYPSEVIATKGDIVKFANSSGFTVELIVPQDLFTNAEGEQVDDGIKIVIPDNKSVLLEIAVNNQTRYYDVVFVDPSKQVTEYIRARPRIVVNPSN